MFALYNSLYTALLLVVSPYFLLRAIFGRHGVRERLGFLPPRVSQLKGESVIWIHAASVGEVKLIPILIRALAERNRGHRYVLTTTTKTGQVEARKLLSRQVDSVFYQPADLPWVTDRVIKQIKPRMLILVETEFWPNLIKSVKRQGGLVGLVNGRISSRSFSRYSLIRPFAREVLSLVDFFCLQTEKDLHRLNELGGQVNRMKVVGSLKFDQNGLAPRSTHRLNLQSLGLAHDRKVLVAGSTRPGEEEIVLAAFARLRQTIPLSLVLAPRHLNRVGEIEAILQERDYHYTKRTESKSGGKKDFEILILDTIGELTEIYAVADLAFVGGSLVPLGGHNPLEPAALGIPVLFGPYMEHSQAAAELLTSTGLGFKVRDENEFFAAAQNILSNGLNTSALFANFQKALQDKAGAAQRTADIILQKLASPRP